VVCGGGRSGGYEGQWASDIFGRYCCNIHIFEPVKQFADNIHERFARNPKIRVNPFGLAGKDRTEQIHLSANSSSVFESVQGPAEEIRLVSAATYLQESGVSAIDLIKINIEGGEYELLEHLIETGAVANIRDIQVQFHDFVPNAATRMEKIQSLLGRTHRPTYQYPFVWENWTRK
jgi:FkbM family methyltransferase